MANNFTKQICEWLLTEKNLQANRLDSVDTKSSVQVTAYRHHRSAW